ncbi:MAG TPA: hypothetical protein VFH26_02120 [Gemmatimonadales bacterium]|nr:hypothetical protein [Gemmatimonadales bacterium]
MRISDLEQLTMTMTDRLSRPFIVLMPLAAAILVSACAGVTPIRDLLNDPSKYDGKTVRIEGEVQGSAGGLGVGAYEVKDDTGRLTVISEDRDPPRSGAKVGVKGKFQALLSLGIKSLAVLREESRDLE